MILPLQRMTAHVYIKGLIVYILNSLDLGEEGFTLISKALFFLFTVQTAVLHLNSHIFQIAITRL